jgi:hypothetical protein
MCLYKAVVATPYAFRRGELAIEGENFASG